MNDRKVRLMVWQNMRLGVATDFKSEYERLANEKAEFLADRVRALVYHIRNTRNEGNETMKRFPTKREFECGASYDCGRGETWLSMFQINPYPRVYRVGGRGPSGEFVSRTFTTITEARKFMRSAFRAHN